jgi:transposase-like protein
MAKKSNQPRNRYTAEFQQNAIERMKHGENVRALAHELGVSRTTLYFWRRKASRLPRIKAESDEPSSTDPRRRTLEEAVAELERLELELGKRSVKDGVFRAASANRKSPPRASVPDMLRSTPKSARRRRRKRN